MPETRISKFKPSAALHVFRTRPSFVLLLLFLTSAATPHLVKDINTTAIGSGLCSKAIKTSFGTFFCGDSLETGRELWKTDGTEAGTVLLKDIRPGVQDSKVGEFVYSATDHILYFAATDGVHGTELWKTDGTASGTVMVKDISAGAGNSAPKYLTLVGNVLYFVAYSSGIGAELWKTDGTALGTVLVKDIKVGSSSSEIKHLIDIDGVLFFSAKAGAEGRELWKSEGDAGTTLLVKDINTVGLHGIDDNYSGNPYFTNYNNWLYFVANDDVNGFELWKSDGTAANTTMVKDIRSGASASSPRDLTVSNGTLFFSASTDLNGTVPSGMDFYLR